MLFKQDGIVYDLKHGVAFVEGLSDVLLQNIIIPSEIQGFPVEIVAENAFWGMNIISIVLPHSINKIEAGAFSHCEKLETVTRNSISRRFVREVLSIEPSAFEQCTNLKKFQMSKPLSLTNHCFANCIKLKTIDSVIQIDGDAFISCKRLSTVTFSQNCDLTRFVDKNSGIKTYNFLGNASLGFGVLENIKSKQIKIECYNTSNLCELAYDGISVYTMDELF